MTTTPSKLRISDTTTPAMESVTSLSKSKWTEASPTSGRPMSRETRKRYILGGACLAFFCVIIYANTSVTHKKAKLMTEWQEGVQKQGAAYTLSSASSPTDDPVTIPRIIHQTWTSSDRMLPEFAEFTNTWKQHYPAWNYRFWSDEDNSQLVREHYSWLMPFYSTLPHPSHRADIAKYLYMHKFGGIFAGISTYCTRAFNDSLLTGKSVILATIGSEGPRGGPQGVSGAFLASEPGQPFFHFVITKAMSLADEGIPLSQRARVESTGSTMLHRAAQHYRLFHQDGTHNLTLLDPALVVDSSNTGASVAEVKGGAKPCVLAPVDNFDASACTHQFPSAYVLVTGASGHAASEPDEAISEVLHSSKAAARPDDTAATEVGGKGST